MHSSCFQLKIPRLASLSKLLCASITIIACSWLVLRLRGLKPAVRKGSFCRLVGFLAFLDALFGVSCFLYVIFVELLQSNLSQRQRFDMAVVTIYLFDFFRISSILCELAIAVQCLLFAQRWRLCQRVHRIWIVLVVIGGIFAQMILAFASPWNYCPESGIIAQPGRRSLIIYAVCGAGAFLLGMIVYVIIICSRYSQDLPCSVQRRRRWQLGSYPVNFLLTYGLTIYVIIMYVIDPSSVTVWKTVISNDLELLGGFLNVAVYAWQCRLALHLGAASRTKSENLLRACKVQSCDVEFGRVSIIEIPDRTATLGSVDGYGTNQTRWAPSEPTTISSWLAEFDLLGPIEEESHLLPVYREAVVKEICAKLYADMRRTPMNDVKAFLRQALAFGLHPLEHDEIVQRFISNFVTDDSDSETVSTFRIAA